MSLIESTLHPEAAVFRHVIPAGEPYLFEVKAGQTLRLLDLEGNQAVDTLFFRPEPARALRPAAHPAPAEQRVPDHRHRARSPTSAIRC